ncbi:ABC transporter ATP-binding protein [Niveispirillum sp. KHB5.9]|uniref:ABC transporter ATP-binding protein n=1 Tax=Niveispirillum sp. KHB5.9 TaxID=3400269 RepID=UPI003A8B99B0
MSEVVVDRLVKHYGPVQALHEVSLHVPDGEFLTLLGPSGCGKSTTLFAIAGLDSPSGGRITVGGRTFYDGSTGLELPPEKRNLGLVFQSYALWPHMNVRQNLAFPLRLRKVGRKEQDVRIEEALSLVEMGAYIDRYPHELSGGQQQRVALARTLVFRPSLLLLDEPLSNLDAKLRIKARSWLKQLQRQLGLTTIYVTHDQSEALALSDRIAVMEKGRVSQLGTPEEIYRRPANAFVADFVGASNFLPGEIVERTAGTAKVKLAGGEVLSALWPDPASPPSGALVTVRPEHIALSAEPPVPGPGLNILSGRIVERSYLGARLLYAVDCGGGLVLMAETETRVEGDSAWLRFAVDDTLLVRA